MYEWISQRIIIRFFKPLINQYRCWPPKSIKSRRCKHTLSFSFRHNPPSCEAKSSTHCYCIILGLRNSRLFFHSGFYSWQDTSKTVPLRGHMDRERPSHSISPGTEASRAEGEEKVVFIRAAKETGRERTVTFTSLEKLWWWALIHGRDSCCDCEHENKHSDV